MKAALLFGLMTVASANICANPDATREQFIEEGVACQGALVSPSPQPTVLF